MSPTVVSARPLVLMVRLLLVSVASRVMESMSPGWSGPVALRTISAWPDLPPRVTVTRSPSASVKVQERVFEPGVSVLVSRTTWV